MNLYQQKAQEIIKDSIKSAIFIDEKAWMPFEAKSVKKIDEEELTHNLFNNFKENGISLAVHKFIKGDEDENLENYFFDGRDLVLLDWKLEDKGGEEYSLKLLEKAISKPHIHFCCIYTFETDPDQVLKNILSYFSGETESRYLQIQENLSEHQPDIEKILPEIQTLSFYRNDKNRVKQISSKLKQSSEQRDLIKAISDECQDNDICSLIKVGIAFEKTKSIKSAIKQDCPELVVPENHIVVIKNTIILILNKNYATDSTDLIKKITNLIIGSNENFTQLLGLEMQNLIEKKGAFIDKNLIQVNRNHLLHHRKQTLEGDLKTDLPFKDLIKEILLEHLRLGLSVESLTLLDDSTLTELSEQLTDFQADNNELCKLNSFYNSSQLNKEGQNINFGDIFLHVNANEYTYYICITALCDCLRSDKIDNVFYFAKGTKMNDKEIALKLGDTSFLSYLPNGNIVKWAEIETGKDDIAKYKPIYIKPLQLKVADNKIRENKISIKLIGQENTIETIKLEYITTLKQNYTQRIANHAFAHPVRVGVDFVKK